MSKIQYDGGLTAALSVKDMGKAIKWYSDNLGFKLQYKMDEMGWCELESPVARVNVGLSQVEKLDVKGGATLTFGVKDIKAARGELEKKGVKFDGEIMTIEGMVSLTTFFDPDGNKLMFYQSLSK
ncbi:VOC family protein [Candidatus Acetothermia bacterium]|nr:VOC family protein [Candidatus Acetothermia bacterium]MBI3643354.1 VOC family protein [Candidatus Acetothermia bacterium]